MKISKDERDKNVTIMTLVWENIVTAFEAISRESGLYQIYGDSPIYGIDQLLYIGKAGNLKKRN